MSAWKPGRIAITLMSAVLLLQSGSTAFAIQDSAPLTPELAAKRENYRKQKEQQHISQDQRKAAAEALKAERLKRHQARQAVKHHKTAPAGTESN